LFKGFEKQFDPLPIFVDGRNGRGSQSHVVGEKDQDFILFGIIELNAAMGIGAFLKSFHPPPFDQFIFENIAVLGNLFSPTTSYKAFSFIRVTN